MESDQQLLDRYAEYADDIAELVAAGEIALTDLDGEDRGYLARFHPELTPGDQE
jgi:hypothetical protein